MQRKEELRRALNSIGLGWLLELLHRAKIGSMSALRSYGQARIAQNVLRRALKQDEQAAFVQMGLALGS